MVGGHTCAADPSLWLTGSNPQCGKEGLFGVVAHRGFEPVAREIAVGTGSIWRGCSLASHRGANPPLALATRAVTPRGLTAGGPSPTEKYPPWVQIPNAVRKDCLEWWRIGDLNPCYRLERAAS